ncbi:MAG: hypothetical protein LC799_27825, partial [Actinobacteria bacterium]|nr:hypothetical protein [Actinomycetota bacterium]
MRDVGPLIDKGIDTATIDTGPIDTGLIGTGSVTRRHGLDVGPLARTTTGLEGVPVGYDDLLRRS